MGKKKIKNKEKTQNKSNGVIKKETKKTLKSDKNEQIKLSKKENEIKEKLKEIKRIKYLSCCYCDDGLDEGFEAYKENGEKVPYEVFGMGDGFQIDVDEGKIMNWPEKGLYLKLFIKVVDTGTYVFSDEDNKTIFEESGYVPDILGINEPAYGDYINFDTDIHGKILGWQDTLELFTGRQYFKNTYISGCIDYIFGTNNTTSESAEEEFIAIMKKNNKVRE